jgi:hypothetical protein
MKNTKFIAAMVGCVMLVGAALLGKFTGDLGLYVSGMVISFITGNAFITGRALSNGVKEPE